ncbi:KpsF/GutQ family sugar-phosphate isomerase [Pelagicoccus sp. SDUM812003]|uniref:KpsF/GutQ family sugar-phosphate isomerase n=1 Tax=Pelagicoccus sp. SDUM812003 TaxID=3041267 RepID=UPI00280D9C5E|nr:KpsF/GutQ family sugar-phosphate isomerase [Pelagicoccus sp. SDUM812003]MDQ8201668.1 KpsF/GutQ family sugar-phosphate isomerase [Pelagicoccus sp. SDUM812003]
MDKEQIIAKGRRCLEIEIAALQATRDHLGDGFADVVLILKNALVDGKKLILSGVGKNAHICQKLVGTLNSIGAPSCFLDPVQALHGDMGLCREGDALLAFSNSGETAELLRFLPMVQRFDVKTIGVTAASASTLCELCDASLIYSVEREACPLDLAPTASTTASMAIGDAVAMVLLELNAFSREDFAKFHPGGNLGRVLAPKVDEIMRGGDRLACLPLTASCKDCLAEMSAKSCGCIALVNQDRSLAGIMTDGDIRRFVLSHPDFLQIQASEVMTRNPITIASGSYAAEALKTFESHSIDDLLVVDGQNRPIGIIDGQDLTKLRIV